MDFTVVFTLAATQKEKMSGYSVGERDTFEGMFK